MDRVQAFFESLTGQKYQGILNIKIAELFFGTGTLVKYRFLEVCSMQRTVFRNLTATGVHREFIGGCFNWVQ
jgi:hypothetical protein